MSAIGVLRVGTPTIAGDFLRTPPVVTVTSPAGTVTASPITVTWTYSSPVGRPQVSYRVRLLSQDSSTVLYDSGAIPGTDLTFDVDYALSPGSVYVVEVICYEAADFGSGTTTVLYDVGTTTFPSNRAVGSVYEVGINGQGYMLADHPEKERRYQRRIIPLDAPRLATGDTPFSQSIDRYTLASSIDWSDGAGQRVYDRDSSSSKAFERSDLIDPFSAGQLTLAPACTLKHSDTYVNARVVVANGELYVLTADGEWSMYTDPGDGAPTVFSITGAGVFKDVCSDGSYWYYTDGSNIYRNNSAADPGSAWSASDAEIIEWCSDRIVIARDDGTSSTPNVVAVLAEDGTEVGGTQLWTFQANTTVRSITSGDGYIWWAASRGDRSTVHGWRIGSTDSYFNAFEMPTGSEARSIGYYQGNVFIRATDGSGKAVIYRCVTQEGLLAPTKVLELSDVGIDHTEGEFAGDDRFVYFSWRQMGTPVLDNTKTGSGLGVIDLVTGGWTKWLVYPQSTTEGIGPVRSIVVWQGRPVFSIDQLGAVMGSADDGAGYDGTAAAGVLETSLYDLGTGLRKMFSELTATFDPLPVGGQITISYSIDGGNTFFALDPIVTPGVKVARWTINQESDSVAFRIKLENTDTGLSPVFRTLTVRAHPVGLADQLLVLPINCADNMAGLNGRPLPENGNGVGARRSRTLENLAQSRVTVQDVDWAITRTTQEYDVVAVETESVGVFDRSKNRQSQHMVTTLTLRRTFK
jgi:hypothetical protein